MTEVLQDNNRTVGSNGMKRLSTVVVALTWLVCADAAIAGKYNEVLSLGDAAPAWTDLPGVDDQKHSLTDLREKAIVVVVFTCNSCPCAVDYEERLLAFCKKYAGAGGKVGVVAINVNTIDADKLPAMKKRAELKKFPFPYLYDESQKIAKAYGATYTPEFFVLDAKRQVAYMGAMDEKDPPAPARRLYLEDAVEALLAGKRPDVGETSGRGCKIRYNDKQRKK
jgi:peroxiredoxin